MWDAGIETFYIGPSVIKSFKLDTIFKLSRSQAFGSNFYRFVFMFIPFPMRGQSQKFGKMIMKPKVCQNYLSINSTSYGNIFPGCGYVVEILSSLYLEDHLGSSS